MATRLGETACAFECNGPRAGQPRPRSEPCTPLFGASRRPTARTTCRWSIRRVRPVVTGEWSHE